MIKDCDLLKDLLQKKAQEFWGFLTWVALVCTAVGKLCPSLLLFIIGEVNIADLKCTEWQLLFSSTDCAVLTVL